MVFYPLPLNYKSYRIKESTSLPTLLNLERDYVFSEKYMKNIDELTVALSPLYIPPDEQLPLEFH